MAIKKVDSGYRVDFRPRGSTKRIRRIFKTKSEAVRYQAWIENNLIQNPEWQPKPKDTRRLGELVRKWRQLHGQTLRDGDGRLQMLHAACRRWGDPVAIEITKTSYLEYRAKGLDELTYLSHEQIRALLQETDSSRNKDLGLSCASALPPAPADRRPTPAGRTAPGRKITFTHAKNGKNRTIPISETLFDALKSKEKRGRLFRDSIYAFQEALKRAEIELPPRQCSHVLRHTFASHFMMNGGDIITLQRILGHSTITVTMRYAHLSPNHLNDAVHKNPLAST